MIFYSENLSEWEILVMKEEGLHNLNNTKRHRKTHISRKNKIKISNKGEQKCTKTK